MKVTAKCQNYSECLKAYRGESLQIAEGEPLVCPECAKPLTVVKSSLGRFIAPVLIVAALASVGVGFYINSQRSAPGSSTSNPTTEEPTTSTDSPATPEPATQPTSTEAPAAEPSAPITAPTKINLDLGDAETKDIKTEVLKRIDLMPEISQSNKDKLYASVERARRMGKVLTIPFMAGRTTLASTGIPELKTALESPEIAKLRDDPTAVFVILGYADLKGDKKKNLTISQTRADSVLSAMRDKCNVVNVMHSVAMGGSTLVDTESLEKNRIVEIWAILP